MLEFKNSQDNTENSASYKDILRQKFKDINIYV